VLVVNKDELSKMPPVKFDLQTRFGTIYGDEEKKAIEECLARDAPTSDKSCIEFQKKFAEYCGSKYAITVSNGTTALMSAYIGLDLKPGDEVITTPITWIATAAAAVVLGAKIKFCDIDPETFNLDPTKLKALITPKTKIIAPVHMYGQPCDMDPILEIAAKNNIKVCEDSAHAPGGSYKGKKTGNIGQASIFSFHEQKNMSTLGEGGMVTTNDSEVYERVRSYKSHCTRVIGASSKYMSFPADQEQAALEKDRFWYQDFDDCGYNFRMNDVTAAVGLVQLKKLDSLNAKRIVIANKLTKELASIPGIKPLKVIKDVVHTYHLYPVLIDAKAAKITRDEFVLKLRKDYGVKSGVHYMPLVATTAFKTRGFTEKNAPIACAQWEKLVTLPIHPRMTDEHVNYLIDSIRNLIKK
jgi:perosamine synthetase